MLATANCGVASALAGAEWPKRGGRLRVGHVGAGVSETLDPHAIVAPIDNARAVNLFYRLTR